MYIFSSKKRRLTQTTRNDKLFPYTAHFRSQRSRLVASAQSGKSVILQHIAHALTANHPDCTLIVLLIDERPEEVTEMQRSVRGEVVASTFDEPEIGRAHV